MIIVDVQQAASNLEGLLRKAGQGEMVVIAIDSQPVAELHPIGVATTGPRPYGLCAGEFLVPDDFDAALPTDILADLAIADPHR